MPATSSSTVATEHWLNCYDRRSTTPITTPTRPETAREQPHTEPRTRICELGLFRASSHSKHAPQRASTSVSPRIPKPRVGGSNPSRRTPTFPANRGKTPRLRNRCFSVALGANLVGRPSRGSVTRRRRARRSGPSQGTQRGQELFLSPRHKPVLLVGAHRHQRYLVEAGVEEGFDLLDVLLDVGAAGKLLADLLGGHELSRRLEGWGTGEVGVDPPAQPEPPELL